MIIQKLQKFSTKKNRVAAGNYNMNRNNTARHKKLSVKNFVSNC